MIRGTDRRPGEIAHGIPHGGRSVTRITGGQANARADAVERQADAAEPSSQSAVQIEKAQVQARRGEYIYRISRRCRVVLRLPWHLGRIDLMSRENKAVC